MTDEIDEHIDQHFKEHYEQVDVQFNAAHWNQLSRALAAAAAGAAAVAATGIPDTSWVRLTRYLRHHKNIFAIVIATLTLLTAFLIFFHLQKDNTIQPANPADLLLPEKYLNPSSTPSHLADSLHFHRGAVYNDSVRRVQEQQMLALDSLISPVLIGVDTVDSLRVDSLDGFLFW
jgi:hypothetical protein